MSKKRFSEPYTGAIRGTHGLGHNLINPKMAMLHARGNPFDGDEALDANLGMPPQPDPIAPSPLAVELMEISANQTADAMDMLALEIGNNPNSLRRVLMLASTYVTTLETVFNPSSTQKKPMLMGRY